MTGAPYPVFPVKLVGFQELHAAFLVLLSNSSWAAYDARRRMKHWTKKIGLEYFQPSPPRSRLICPLTTKHLQPRLDGWWRVAATELLLWDLWAKRRR